MRHYSSTFHTVLAYLGILLICGLSACESAPEPALTPTPTAAAVAARNTPIPTPAPPTPLPPTLPPIPTVAIIESPTLADPAGGRWQPPEPQKDPPPDFTADDQAEDLDTVLQWGGACEGPAVEIKLKASG